KLINKTTNDFEKAVVQLSCVGWSSSAMAVGFAICIFVLSYASTCGVAAAGQMEEIRPPMPRSLLANELGLTPPMGISFVSSVGSRGSWTLRDSRIGNMIGIGRGDVVVVELVVHEAMTMVCADDDDNNDSCYIGGVT
ncbi:hypothetical protein CMV_030815, partial [Castanea mollissima]